MTVGILLNALKNIRNGKVPYSSVCEYADRAIKEYEAIVGEATTRETTTERDPIRTFVNKKLKKDLTSPKL
jgi:hypothetical protein